MNMFESLLNSIPKNRSEMVNDLELPEVTLRPYIWMDLEDSISIRSDSVLNSFEGERFERGSYSTDSSIPLSRAMTDSEISYGRYKRYKNMGYDNCWEQLRDAFEAFPSDYLTSLSSYQTSWTDDTSYEQDLTEIYAAERRQHSEELRLKMERYFDTECYVYGPDDPGLYALEEALHNLDMKALEADLESLKPF